MSWSNLGNYLNKFKNFKPPSQFVQGSVVEIIDEVLGIAIKVDDLYVKGGIVYLKTDNAMIKNQIFLHKEKILEKFSKAMGNKAPGDIRFG